MFFDYTVRLNHLQHLTRWEVGIPLAIDTLCACVVDSRTQIPISWRLSLYKFQDVLYESCRSERKGNYKYSSRMCSSPSRCSFSNPSVTLIGNSYTVLSECQTYPFSILVVSKDLAALVCCTAIYMLKFQLRVYKHNSEYLIKPRHVQITV